jgi:hypothetical protein
MINGRARWMGIGSFDTIGLAEAREKARLYQSRKMVARSTRSNNGTPRPRSRESPRRRR